MLYQRTSWKIERKDWKNLLLAALTGQTLSIVTQESGTKPSEIIETIKILLFL